MPDKPEKQDRATQPRKPQKPEDEGPPAGENEAINDPPTKKEPGDDEETMPIEEGFSIVP